VESRDFIVKVIKTGAEERKDVKHPIHPIFHLLPVFQIITGFPTHRSNGPSIQCITEIVALLRGKYEGHHTGGKNQGTSFEVP